MKIGMSHKQAAYKIKNWYLIHRGVFEISVSGKETFTLFDKTSASLQKSLRTKIELHPEEIPVLVLRISNGRFIVNTSERFIRITPFKNESIYYREFEDFVSHEVLYTKEETRRNKKPVYTIKPSEIGLRKVTGDIIFWKIPTGTASYLFWNVTRQVNIIGIE
jgi:hypothetical protein